MMTTEKTVELTISGMSCGSCVRHVTEALRGVAGVTDAAVDLAGRRATVSGSASLDPKALVSAVDEAGYEAAVV